jgi:putative nucleotidyltransferase with HDIG domain
MKKLPLKLKTFFTFIYILTTMSLLIFIKTKYLPIEITNYKNIIFFSLLVTITETFTVSFKNMSFSTTFAIELASFIIFGPLTTIIVVLLGYSFRILKTNNKYKHIFNTPIYGTAFNYCVFILPLLFSTYVYKLLGGQTPTANIYQNLLQIFAFCITCFFANSLIISIMFSIINNKNIFYSYMSNIKLAVLNMIAISPIGIIVVIIFYQYKYFGLLLLLCPIILVRYTYLLYIDSKTQYVQTVDALALAVEARDRYTEGHSKRVAEISEMIAKQLKYSEFKIEDIKIAALLHDVGKIGIDDRILNKPGKLTEEEFNEIKKHPEIGYKILKGIKNFDNIVKIVKYHHERYDGGGYPSGCKADELSLDVYIVQLADAVDAMASERPYRKALPEEYVINEVKKNSGKQFHPVVVDAYLSAIEKQKKKE